MSSDLVYRLGKTNNGWAMTGWNKSELAKSKKKWITLLWITLLLFQLNHPSVALGLIYWGVFGPNTEYSSLCKPPQSLEAGKHCLHLKNYKLFTRRLVSFVFV